MQQDKTYYYVMIFMFQNNIYQAIDDKTCKIPTLAIYINTDYPRTNYISLC